MVLFASLLACDADRDGDGFANPEDCDDLDGVVHPGAEDDTCDGVDQDCDGWADEGASGAQLWYRDADGDGYGTVDRLAPGCDAPAGFVDNALDCDDDDATASPDGLEGACNGVDDDCDGDLDEDDAAATPWYADTAAPSLRCA